MDLKRIGIIAVALVGSYTFAQNSKMADIVTEFEADNWALSRTYIVQESEEYYQRFSTFYNDWNKKLSAVDFNALSQQGKVDYVLLKNLVNKGEYFLNQEYDAFKEVSEVSSFAKDIFPAETLAVTCSPSWISPDKIALASAVSNSF